jgi:hypothetical protein
VLRNISRIEGDIFEFESWNKSTFDAVVSNDPVFHIISSKFESLYDHTLHHNFLWLSIGAQYN